MPARLPQPSVKVNVRIYEADYALIRASLIDHPGYTPTDLIRDLAHAWAENRRAQIAAAVADAARLPDPPS